MPRYSRQLLEHARKPRCSGAMDDADAVGTADLNGRAPQARVFLAVTDQVIRRCTFQAFGCGCLIAACSVLTEHVTNHSLDQAAGIEPADVITALDGIPSDKAFCVDIALRALRDALSKLRPMGDP